jgi:NTP pyrophosphatase (non-canonical NTP hydrolase)
MSEFNELTQAVNTFIEDRDWKQFHKPKDCAISLTLEAAEVAELFQWKSDKQMEAMKQEGEAQDDLADELSDVLFWVLAMAHDFNIDIKPAFLRKLKKSAAKYPVEKVKGNNKKYTQYDD